MTQHAPVIAPAFADRLPVRPKRFSDQHLLWSAFERETGTWAQRYDRHVRDWQRSVAEETHVRFHTDGRFAAAYDDCRAKAAEALAEWNAGLKWGRA